MSYLRILNTAWELHQRPREADAPSVISLFAGCGGSSLGFSIAGYRELLAVEWEENAAETFKLNFPDVALRHADIKNVSVDWITERLGVHSGELDVLQGSPPCQGFSQAGSRNVDDDRNQLFKEYVRILKGLMPKVFVMENVAGLVKGKMKPVFVEILKELKACGYNVSARLMNAKYFHVPQSRERLIFIGVRNDLNISPRFPSPITTFPYTIRDAIADLPKEQDSSIDHTWIDESPTGRNTKGYHLALKGESGKKYAGQQIRTEWDKPFPTITKGGNAGGKYLRNTNCHPFYTRVFSTRELARGQSFPDQFQFVDGQGIERIGNSVPPLMMEEIARHIRLNILNSVA